ncbi:MAG: hypothetical protein Q7T09_16160 [Phenylobacterium sp.]|nr:hypothetical protein [Phenylobacterium sp.]
MLLLLGHAAWAGASRYEPVFAFAVTAGPVASLWIFWLIAREPPAQRVTQKWTRLAAILLVLTPPLAVSIPAGIVGQTDTTGLGTLIAVFIIAPWAAVQIVPGVIALWRVAFQGLAPSETASAPVQAG